MFRVIKCKEVILGMILAVAFTQSAYCQVTTIFNEAFNGAAGTDLGASLNENWITAFDRQNGGTDNGALSIFGADGSVDKIGNGSNAQVDAGALLALPGGQLLANSIYTLSATVDNNNANWTAIGFASSDAVLDSTGGRHSNGNAAQFGGYAWTLTRNLATGTDQEVFGGGGTSAPAAGGNLGGDFVATNVPLDFTVVLDTTDTAAIEAEYFFNGTSVLTQTLGAGAFGNIGFVGISSDGATAAQAADNGNASSVSNFVLTVEPAAVPEPTSLALLSLGSLAVFTRRRRVA